MRYPSSARFVGSGIRSRIDFSLDRLELGGCDSLSSVSVTARGGL